MKEKLTKEWKPLTNPQFGVEILAQWRPLLDDSLKQSSNDNNEYEDSEFSFLSSKKKESFETYQRLVEEIVLPRIRHVIVYVCLYLSSHAQSTFIHSTNNNNSFEGVNQSNIHYPFILVTI